MGKKVVSRPNARGAKLAKIRDRKLASAPENFVRGTPEHFYRWLRKVERHAIPEGPAIWICGDCHYGNLGPVADSKGEICFRLRDFDQSVVGNPAHDILRLALSLASAARGSNLPGLVTVRMLDAILSAYCAALGRSKEPPAIPPPLAQLMKSARKVSWRTFARNTMEDEAPTLPLGKTFWPLTGEERKEVDGLFADPKTIALLERLRPGEGAAPSKVVAATYWRKGCSSLGRLRYAILASGGNEARDDYCFIDVKEAVASQAPHAEKAVMPKDPAERVAEGARYLAPELGDRMVPVKLHGRSACLRELLPQDMKVEINRLDVAEATGVAAYLAYTVGEAHARQMSREDRTVWRRGLSAKRSPQKARPNWLWTNVVDLLAVHDRAYLEHCRAVANKTG